MAAGELAVNTNGNSANIHFEDADGVVRSVGSDPLVAGDYVRRVSATNAVGTWEINALIWSRAGTVISPSAAGDDVDLGTGDLSANSADISGGNIKLNANGTAVFNTPSDSTFNITFANIGGAPQSIAAIYDNTGTLKSQWRPDLFWLGGSSSSPNIKLNANGTAIFTGNVTAPNVSDVKFKTDIQPAGPQLADVVALGNSLKNWTWTDEAPLQDDLKSRRFLGLIAQEAEKVCPQLVYTVNRGGGDADYKALNTDILVMKLLGAVAEQNARIEALEAEVQSLKGA